VRPRNVTAPASLTYGGTYQATFTQMAPGVSISKAVLMAPGSVTHHSDMGQRYVDLHVSTQSLMSVDFVAPVACSAPNLNLSCAPPGYYLLIFVTNTGLPSDAVFVRLN
jgi:hypothetical protein